MPRFFTRPSAVLSAFPVSRYSTVDGSTQRQTHDILRHSIERMWHPFTMQRHGADLKAYRFSEHLAELCTPGNTFTCQVNGAPGGKRVLEDFFATLVAGFDVVHVNVESARGSSLCDLRDTRNYRGYFVLEHTRPFLGWAPTPTSLRLPAAYARVPDTTTAGAGTRHDDHSHDDEGVDIAAAAAAFRDTAAEAAERFCPPAAEQHEVATVKFAPSNLSASSQHPSTLVVPFSTYVEGVMGGGRLSHVVLRSPAMELLSSCVECPEEVRRCLLSKEAMKMFTTLRRAGVKPEIITAKTLLSASKQNEVWSAALGIL